MSKKTKKEKAESQKKLINKLVCNFITQKFLLHPKDGNGNAVTQNQYSGLVNLSSSLLSKMKDEDGYEIPLATIYSICQKEGISLSDFFKEFEKEFGEDIPI